MLRTFFSCRFRISIHCWYQFLTGSIKMEWFIYILPPIWDKKSFLHGNFFYESKHSWHLIRKKCCSKLIRSRSTIVVSQHRRRKNSSFKLSMMCCRNMVAESIMILIIWHQSTILTCSGKNSNFKFFRSFDHPSIFSRK